MDGATAVSKTISPALYVGAKAYSGLVVKIFTDTFSGLVVKIFTDTFSGAEIRVGALSHFGGAVGSR
jgi:hypothetical protein